MRYDPDNNVKRSARKGERRCGECYYFDVDACQACVRPPYDCRADDYAGDCKHFSPRREGDHE